MYSSKLTIFAAIDLQLFPMEASSGITTLRTSYSFIINKHFTTASCKISNCHGTAVQVVQLSCLKHYILYQFRCVFYKVSSNLSTILSRAL